MDIKEPGWERALTEFVQDDIDGRFWLDDMVRRVIDEQIPSKYWDEYLDQHADDVEHDSFEAGREQGYEDGFNDGQDQYNDESFVEGYEEGWSDGRKGNPPLYGNPSRS